MDAKCATSLCSPSCRCPAQSPPGRGIETFLARCFLPSVQSQCSARTMGSGADMDKDYLTLRRASASRLSGEWGDDDYDVVADGAVVGRILKAHAAPAPAARRSASCSACAEHFPRR